MYKESIGLIGGFGGYATLNFYRRFLEEFATGCERDYPHIIIDNNFTMPSRTRALLTGEDYDNVVKDIAASLQMLIDQGCTYIVLLCGTAHGFLDDAYNYCPEAKERVLSIIDVLADSFHDGNEKKTLVIAAEGTLKKGIYSKKLQKHGIEAYEPDSTYFSQVRYYIEGVKQNTLNPDMAREFIDFAASLSNEYDHNIILGCTEFPVLVAYIRSIELDVDYTTKLNELHFFDPLELTLLRLKSILK